MIVAGDKRVEPVYAFLDNIQLSIDEHGSLFSQDTVPNFIEMLVENYIADARNCVKNNSHNNFYFEGYTSVDHTNDLRSIDDEGIEPKLNYRFTDSYKYDESHNVYNDFSSQDIRPWIIHTLCIAIPDRVEIRSFGG